jgi:hypothetical protein
MCIEILTGAHNQDDSTAQYVEQELKTMTKEIYCDSDSILLQVVSLNCHGLLPGGGAAQLAPLFLNHKKLKSQLPDMIVVGLQEMVGLGFLKSVGNFFKSKKDNEEARAAKW